ncbi:MAG: hypothetical protein MI976_02480 [Pseudomonadales bacterium]|nr:hypothetical protein [Pseudomonadales bacterium]
MAKIDRSSENHREQRRKTLKCIGITTGLASVGIPLLSLTGCGADLTEEDDTDGNDTSTNDGSTTVEASVAWATGTTDLITVGYPDDSIFEASSLCTVSLTGTTTEGPCYFSVDESEDISEGLSGLPMQLCLQVIDEACNPLEGFVVEVWHCDTGGVYSADTSGSDDSSRFAGNFCTGGDNEAENSQWYRGELTTNSSGRVNFRTCFPGWYSGRTIHIHFRVRNGSYDSVVSQFCFDDGFCEEICTTHDEYSARGSQDTTLSSGRDTVFGSDYADYQMNLEQNSDGTLLAYKVIQVSS